MEHHKTIYYIESFLLVAAIKFISCWECVWCNEVFVLLYGSRLIPNVLVSCTMHSQKSQVNYLVFMFKMINCFSQCTCNSPKTIWQPSMRRDARPLVTAARVVYAYKCSTVPFAHFADTKIQFAYTKLLQNNKKHVICRRGVNRTSLVMHLIDSH